MNDIFSSIANTGGAKGMPGVLESVKNMTVNQGRTTQAARMANSLVSMESIDSTAKAELTTAVTSLHAALEGICVNNLAANKAGKANVSDAQMKAALYAGVMGGDINAAVKAPIKSNVIAQEGLSVVESDELGLENRRAAMEAYDEQSTSTTVAFSIAYNLAAARQDEFGEALFPTVVIPPDQAGMMMTIDLVMLQTDAKHQTTGAVEDFRRSNVIRALTYPTLLQNDTTNIIPVVRVGENDGMFVDETVIAPMNITMDNGDVVTTSALAMGVQFDLLGLSQTDALLKAGVMDVTDSVDPGVSLKDLYLKLVNPNDATKHDVIQFNVADLPLSNFNYAVQGNYKDMVLNFDTSVLTVNKDTLQYDNSVSTLLGPVVTGQYEVRLAITVSGKLNVQFGTTNLFTSKLSVVSVRQNSNNLDITTGPGKTIADIFKNGEFIGYNLDAKRSNMNRRQRGQLVDTTTYRQYYKLPLLAPITVPRPHSAGDANDARDLNALIFTTHVRTSNAAVDKLLATGDVLKAVVGTQARAGDSIEVLGLARWLVDPQWDSRVYSAPAVVDSLSSHERAADIQASLVNMIRDMAYSMYQNSGYKPAADSQNGGMSAPPTVIIATDQEIARYLTVTGDLRTLGDHFPVKIVSTTNIKMRGKIYITFGDFTTAEAGVPNVLHFGTMQYRPELTVVLPTARDGSYSKEITVSPSFRHHVNLPILGYIAVSGISDVVDAKLPIDMKAVV